jgi:hypothetical protein
VDKLFKSRQHPFPVSLLLQDQDFRDESHLDL